jgi:hypothetical protein
MDQPKFVIEEVTESPESAARRRATDDQFRRNSEWLQTHWGDLIPQVYGKHLAVAGQEAFFGDDLDDVITRAKSAHPEDAGMYVRYVRHPIGPRIYGNRG